MYKTEESISTPAHCPPAEILFMVCAGELGEPYAEAVRRHAEGCRTCRLQVSGILDLLDDEEITIRLRTAHRAGPAGRGAPSVCDWRRTTYNCGDPERQPRTHLIATRRLILASVGPANSDLTAEYEAWIEPIDWSWGHRSPRAPIRADDLEDLAELLRAASDSADRTITVFLPAEATWLVEPLLRDAAGRWRVFIADTPPRGRARRPLMTCHDEITGSTCWQVETWPEEGARMARWLLDKQDIGAGRLAGVTFAALGRVLGRGDSERFVPASDPLMVVIPADDPPFDDDELFAMYAQGHRDLISTP